MPSKSFSNDERRIKKRSKRRSQRCCQSLRGPVPGLERVSLISQLRTRPPNKKSCAAPQPWLRAGQGLCTQHLSTSGLFRMTTKPVTWQSKPRLSVNFQGSDIHDWNDSRTRWAGPSSVACWSSLTCQSTLATDLQQVDVLWIFLSLITQRRRRDHPLLQQSPYLWCFRRFPGYITAKAHLASTTLDFQFNFSIPEPGHIPSPALDRAGDSGLWPRENNAVML
jgi:hypothetical protein